MQQMAPLGPVYQAGTLSGNPLAMAAGLAMLRELREGKPNNDLKRRAARLEAGLAEAAERAGLPVISGRVGSVMTMFFAREPVHDYATAKAADVELYSAFFVGKLGRGFYFAPSQFEAAFLSTAHTDSDVDATAEAATEILAALGRANG